MNSPSSLGWSHRLKETFGRDFLASIVVFFVALPLCMGIAIASGVEPAKGLITGIVGGLIVGCISGSPLQVSGPAAGLAVINYDVVQRHGVESLGLVVLIAGAVQLVAAVAKVGQWFRAVSPAVVQGMLSGIGVLIFASQFHVMVDDVPKSSGLENIKSIPDAVWKGLIPLDGSPHHWAARVGILTILTIITWRVFAPKKLKFIPATLVAVLLATLFASLLDIDVKRVPVPDKLISAIQMPTWIQLSKVTMPLIWSGIGVAIVASAETLLCATAVDQMHQGPRTKYDRELGAQGLGNMICGCLGALPMTGVIVRSAANVDAGARTRASAIMHGLWILLLVAFAPFLLRLIPTASLGAVLVYTGYKLINPKGAKGLLRFGKGEFFIYLVTLVLIVVEDLLFGVITGVVLSAIKLLYEFSHLEAQLTLQPHGNRADLHLDGAATFMRLPKLAKVLEEVPGQCELHVHVGGLRKIDHACLELLGDWQRQHSAQGGHVIIDWDALNERYRAISVENGHRNGRGDPETRRSAETVRI